MEAIRVVIHGALGKMGRQVIEAVDRETELKVVGAVEKRVTQQYLALPSTSELVPFSSDLSFILGSCRPDVVVDFTNAETAMSAVRITARRQVNLVVGTSGLSQDNLDEIAELCRDNGIAALVVPNFSLGSVLLMNFARVAAKFFSHVEIVEMHHDKKIDAPSGTAIATAKAMLEARGESFIYPRTEKEVLANARGGQMGGIAIHSLRLPGFVAGQEVIFSGAGQTLSLHHEAVNRESYMPGVVLAIKEAVKRKGLIYGLHTLLDL
ncbi:MAG: 4-hydroxy-tetrahydrodipicolinate reductase [Dehalococcoidia bacterium]|nr:4-hydroxy-tetrahydrodipicolinate reductase [Dehalococcoidia bacterium]